MILPFFIALAIASSELWGRRIRYLKHNEEDSIEDCISGLSDGMGRQVGPELLNVEDGDKQDCISGLSDDILSLILSHLSFRDAVKTNKLSRRWRYLHASVPKLDFNSLTMFSQSKGDCMCACYLKKSVKVVNQFIQLYSGLKIFSFGFAFCFGKMFAADIERWITFAIRMGVEELDINFKCNEYLSCVSYKYNYSELRTFSCQLLSEASKLQRLHLHGCILTPSFNVKINSLKCLDLDGVPLAGREVEDILSCCLNLEQLRMRKCILPTKLCVHGPFLRLKNLTINFCLGLKEIDLCASNLNFFECFDHELIEFSFSRVPNLERVFIHMNRAIGMPYIFNELPKDLPQLKTLLVRTATIHVSFIPETITLFSSIRQLELILTTGQSIDLVKITCILSACPLLQKFCLVTTSSSCHSYYKRRKEPPLCHHTQLEEVEFGGFEGSRNELNLALYFLRSAAALRRMFISTKFRFYCGFGTWENKCFHAWNEKEREMIRRHFQGKALSGNAEVIVT